MKQQLTSKLDVSCCFFKGVLSAFAPHTSATGRIVQSFVGLRQKFVAVVHERLEYTTGCACVATAPHTTTAGRIIDTFGGGSYQFVFIDDQVYEFTTRCTCVTTTPHASTTGGVLNLCGFLGIDTNNLVSSLNKSWHSFLCIYVCLPKKEAHSDKQTKCVNMFHFSVILYILLAYDIVSFQLLCACE